jgi:hypothetical protein
MPEQFRERVRQLSRLCRSLIATLSAGEPPARAEVEALGTLIESARPTSRVDPFAGVWHALEAVEILLSMAADEGNGERAHARELSLAHLRVICRDLEGFMQ